jgi:hypothetical protein|tara:strand:- start:972 stop:1178 length:207 start_codon:yes stop_codon:yes gene_type:complete
MNKIDYEELVANLKSMINLLEYDSMRSPGKAKLNSNQLVAMYDLISRYDVKKETSIPKVIKPAVKKKG